LLPLRIQSLKALYNMDYQTFIIVRLARFTEGVDIGVVRNLYYDRERPDIGRALLDLAF